MIGVDGCSSLGAGDFAEVRRFFDGDFRDGAGLLERVRRFLSSTGGGASFSSRTKSMNTRKRRTTEVSLLSWYKREFGVASERH